MILLACFGITLFLLALACLLRAQYVRFYSPVETATPAEHSRLSKLYAARAEQYLKRSHQQTTIAQQLRTSSSSQNSAAHTEFVSRRYQQQAATMEALRHKHQRLALVPKPANERKPVHSSCFHEPAKLRLVR